jgi:hypothetical protein
MYARTLMLQRGSSLPLTLILVLALATLIKATILFVTTVGEVGLCVRDSPDELHDLHSHNTCYSTQLYAHMAPSKYDLYLPKENSH